MLRNIRLSRRKAIELGALASLGVLAQSKVLHQYAVGQALDNPNRNFKVWGKRSLRERAAAKGLLFGTESSYTSLRSDRALARNIIRECNLLVAGGLKWYLPPHPLRPSPYTFDFTTGDWIANFAKMNKLRLRGHTLVWHLSLPPWFEETVTPQNAENFLEKHIRTVIGHFAGQVHSWDVVNEAIDPNDGRADGLRTTPWLNLLGEDYIDLAFRIAASADPKARLVYNDYDLEYDIPSNEAKRSAVLNLLERLKSKGTPIHALGIQGHLTGHETRFNAEKFRKFLADVASLGLKILITEMDVSEKELPSDLAARDRIIAGVYEFFLSATLDERAVIAIITWGLSDRYTWLSDFEPRSDGAAVRPLPLDQNFRRKLAWNAIARTFDQAPKR